MSKDMLGPIPRALAPVDTKYHSVILNVIQRHTGDNAPLWHSRFAKALREKLPKGKPVQHKFLRPVAQAAVEEIFKPRDFYNENNKEIWFSQEFAENILLVAEDFQPTDDLALPSGYDVIKPANDSEVRSEFPADHTYSASEFCWQAKRMVKAQPNGIAGRLLNNGDANIFYVVGKGGEVFAVHVGWYGGHRQWDFSCYSLGESRWNRDDRTFSRN